MGHGRGIPGKPPMSVRPESSSSISSQFLSNIFAACVIAIGGFTLGVGGWVLDGA